jgi:hypothetical protein
MNMGDTMDYQIYAETIAARTGTSVEALQTYAEALIGLEVVGDVGYALDTALLVLRNGDNDKLIDTVLNMEATEQTQQASRRYRGRHIG